MHKKKMNSRQYFDGNFLVNSIIYLYLKELKFKKYCHIACKSQKRTQEMRFGRISSFKSLSIPALFQIKKNIHDFIEEGSGRAETVCFLYSIKQCLNKKKNYFKLHYF